jgi:thioredoxin-related protein
MKKMITFIFVVVTTLSQAQNWQLSFENAQSVATKEDKPILLVFSGSDWCAPCIKLEKNIWMSNEFKETSEKLWVLYKADFPKKKANLLTPELTLENKKLAEKYNKNGSFPLVILIDKNGKILGMTGYKNVAPSEYISIIKKFVK